MKNILYDSLLFKTWVRFREAYKCSRLQACIETLSHWAASSAIFSAFRRFSQKRPDYWNSNYQRALNKLSAGFSILTIRLHELLSRLLSGSRLCGVYFGFVNNTNENRLRAIGVFGFYFFLSAAMLGVLGVIGRGRATVSFILALALFALAFFADKLAAAARNSFFVKILMGLIR